MGALPKRKVSKIRRDRKRAHYLRVKTQQMVPCPQCHSLRLAYHVCPNCGTYRGVEVIEVGESAAQ
jgi:large subunit ribosomal protein L32